MLDLLIINPGGRKAVYQGLGANLTAVEPPLWCRLIAGYMLDRQWTVEILDTEAEEMNEQEAAEFVVAKRPRLVAMVVFGHQPSASTQMMPAAGNVCSLIKRAAPGQKIIIVGGHVSALPLRTVQEESVDYACDGEGPVTIDGLLRGQPLNVIPGLAWRDGDNFMLNAPAPLISVVKLHGAAWHLLPMEKYRAHNWQCFGDLNKRQPYASIYTSLGCPFKCSFCCINAPFHSNAYRVRHPKVVVAEIAYLHTKHGVNTFKIIDEMFVLNKQHYMAICEELAAKPYAKDLNIWAYSRIDTINLETLPTLRAAGIRWLALGIESGSDMVRDGALKSFGESDIIEAVRAVQAAGINVIGNYIFGLPDDTQETMRATLDLAKTLNCEFANFYSAMAYPGSRLYDGATGLPKTWGGYSQHSVDCTPLPTATMTSAEVLQFRDDAFHEYFGNPAYMDMVRQRFGGETADHIEAMASTRLDRELLR